MDKVETTTLSEEVKKKDIEEVGAEKSKKLRTENNEEMEREIKEKEISDLSPTGLDDAEPEAGQREEEF